MPKSAFLLDTLDAKKLDVQRDVVSNERRQSYENRPYGTAQLRTCDLFYPKPHPYYDCVIGTIADIQSASMDDLRAFFRQFYAPNNASISIVGNFNPADAKALVEKYFGAIPRQADVVLPNIPQPPLPGVIKETIHDQVARIPRLQLDWAGVKAFDADEPSADVLAYIVGGGKTWRLYQELVQKQQLASDVGTGNESHLLGGIFEMQATAKQGHTVQEIGPVVERIVDDVRKNGVTDDEVARAKRVILAGKLRGLERIGGFGGKADLLNHYEMYQGDPGYLGKDLARYRAVTADSVKAFANKYLSTERRVILDIEPAPAAPAMGGSEHATPFVPLFVADDCRTRGVRHRGIGEARDACHAHGAHSAHRTASCGDDT